MYTIASWNVNSLNVRLEHVLKWLNEHQPDILAIQETKCVDDKFPMTVLRDQGYHAIYSGQKTYNGVAIFSKRPAEAICTDVPGLADPQRRILAATIDNIRIINLYVPNGQRVDSEKFQYKLDWLKCVMAYIQSQLSHYPQLVVLGDMNIAPEDRDVHDPIAWQDKVHVSPQERTAFNQLLELGLSDSFRLFEQDKGHFTWWDYRMMAFRRKHGLRIDHILITQALVSLCKQCVIDIEPRRWERPSDHTVVYIQLDK